MNVLVVLACDSCNGTAGIGMTLEHAEFNVSANGGRHIAGLRLCPGCAEATR